jgi:anthranilate synthase/aminodeoxychorismate synthase-like glutamine amidotransferase
MEFRSTTMILLIDNYDSFVHNLARYFVRLGCDTRVVRNDAISLAEIEQLAPQAIVLSPGPCTPNEAGVSLDVVRGFHREIPLLGVCLGHQAIAAALGANIVRAPQPLHGRTSRVHHDGRGAFAHLPSPLTVCRYHSLVVEELSLPGELAVTARSDDGLVMALEHREFPVVGVQFHPEAALTEYGYELLSNFLNIAGVRTSPGAEPIVEHQTLPTIDTWPEIATPITF